MAVKKNKHFYAKDGAELQGDPWEVLAAQIIIHAVYDWRELIACRAWHKAANFRGGYSFDELRHFFKSEWCDFIMLRFKIEPAAVLAKLEAELAAAMRKDCK